MLALFGQLDSPSTTKRLWIWWKAIYKLPTRTEAGKGGWSTGPRVEFYSVGPGERQAAQEVSIDTAGARF